MTNERVGVHDIGRDHFGLGTKGHNDVVEPEIALDLHDVAHCRFASDLANGLWYNISILREPCPRLAASDENLPLLLSNNGGGPLVPGRVAASVACTPH